MASTPISLPPYRAETRLTSGDRITPDAHRSILPLYNGSLLIPISTASGALQITVPPAKSNQGQRRTYKKTSTDASIATLVPSGTDKIEFASALALGAAQGSKVTIQSDGVINWYVVS